MSDEIFLNDSWRLYFHEPEHDKWDFESYVPLATLSTVADMAAAHRALHSKWGSGMFFLMREHILPIWEDAHNKGGGCLSYKVMRAEIPDRWFELACWALGESACGEKVCGVSISPKRNYSILRLWVADQSVQAPCLHSLNTPSYTRIMYRSFADETNDAS
jgi:hypothetical protein